MKNLSKELETLIHKMLVSHPLPYKKGKSIRVGPVVIRESRQQGFIIFDCIEQTQLAITYSKGAALAVAKCHINKQDYQEVLRLDRIFQKHDIDCLHYQYIIGKSSNESLRYVNINRLEISEAESEIAKQDIEDILFDK
jgi:hypothetical protein